MLFYNVRAPHQASLVNFVAVERERERERERADFKNLDVTVTAAHNDSQKDFSGMEERRVSGT